MSQESVSSDDRGAIMLIAVFIAIFAVGLLYHLVGISASVLFREKFQDEADAAALSSAIMHARAMNLIVLINIVMAAILSVLVTVKLIETIAIIGMGVAVAISWLTMGASLVAIPPLKTVQSSMQNAYEGLKEPISTALKALNDVADEVREVTPDAALALAEADLQANSALPGTHGVVFGTRPKRDLPVEDDEFSTLCGKAAKLPATLASESLKAIHPVSVIMGELASPMESLGSVLSEWFCGDGSGSPPSYQQTFERPYPRTGSAIACENDLSSGRLSEAEFATNSDCNASKADEDASQPDLITGSCRAGQDCTIAGPYENRVSLAREQCYPTYSGLPAPFVYHYQKREGEVGYAWNGKTWIRGKPAYQIPVALSNSKPPCGPRGFQPVIAEGYNTTVHKNGDASVVDPVCSSEEPPRVPPTREQDTFRTVAFTEVLQILGCKRTETKNIDLSNPQRAGQSGSDKAPKRVQRKDDDGNDVTLGDENFQIRAVLRSQFPAGTPEKVMKLALWHRSFPGNPLSALREFGNYSVAEAEFFYDESDGPSEWMWNMNWRARIRRFRLPSGAAMSKVEEFCNRLPTGCGSILDQLKKLGTLIVH